ncbi:hypothetical protein [Haloferula sp. A504]|uniref:hypothetical protein n=1 Tax=Haloferula sp. A504 TaxID=3373601 RepID=UPI0031C4C631|nr:hypothetical protein [Verrucomicrobiaceae bacterium E54]
MKAHVRRLLVLGSLVFSVWLLSGCYYDPYAPNYNSGGYHGGGYPQGGNRYAYDRGLKYGSQDARRGLARQASRHWNVVPVQDRETFAQGYNAGYHRGGGHGGAGATGPGQQAYNQGVGYGAADARRGLPRQASRHWNVVAGPYREAFATGYNVGYKRR